MTNRKKLKKTKEQLRRIFKVYPHLHDESHRLMTYFYSIESEKEIKQALHGSK
jgi:vacuolar-type H+-ATPase subunit D/Vma8